MLSSQELHLINGCSTGRLLLLLFLLLLLLC